MTLNGKRILVTGARGMLAGDLLRVLIAQGANITACDLIAEDKYDVQMSGLDISKQDDVFDFVFESKADWILNCAAYTNVDLAESQQDLAHAVNVEGPKYLALAAHKLGCRLLHISTDYVFGGNILNGQQSPFSEAAPLFPCGVYGQSKALGEKAVKETCPNSSLIVRTSWLHGVNGPNFIASILRFATEREELKVVNDQFGSPTWAKWLSEVLVSLIEKDARGTYHVSSRGNISWFDYACEIVKQANLSLRIVPQTTKELNRPAPRPAFSTFNVSKLESFLGKTCITWQDGIRGHLSQLGAL